MSCIRPIAWDQNSTSKAGRLDGNSSMKPCRNGSSYKKYSRHANGHSFIKRHISRREIHKAPTRNVRNASPDSVNNILHQNSKKVNKNRTNSLHTLNRLQLPLNICNLLVHIKSYHIRMLLSSILICKINEVDGGVVPSIPKKRGSLTTSTSNDNISQIL